MKRSPLPSNEKWMSISQFNSPLDKVSAEEWASYTNPQKNEKLTETVSYIEKRIPTRILAVLLHDFTLETRTLEGVVVNMPVFFDQDFVQKTYSKNSWWENSPEYGDKKALQKRNNLGIQSVLRINSNPDDIASILRKFWDYIKSLLSIDSISIDTNLFELLPQETKLKVLVHKMKQRLAEVGYGHSIEQLDVFLGKFWKSIEGIILEDILLYSYYQFVIKRWSNGRKIATPEEIKSLGILMSQQPLRTLMEAAMPSIVEISGWERDFKTLEPINKRYSSGSRDGFGFHITQWTQSEIVDYWFWQVRAYYHEAIPSLLKQQLNIILLPQIQLDSLDQTECFIEWKLWWIVEQEREIGKKVEKKLFLRFAYSNLSRLTADQKQAIFELFRSATHSTDLHVTNSSLIPRVLTQGMLTIENGSETDGVFTRDGFAWDSIIISSKWTVSSLQITLAEFSIDKAVYLMGQIDAILKNGKAFEESEYYITMMRAYNQQLMWNNEVYPIENTPQYRDFMRMIIFPHSGKWWAKHILLCGLPWTGKSQYMFHMLSQDSFSYNNIEFHMESIVIPISLADLAQMLKEDRSAIRQRLYHINEKTGKNILLVIEDIDLLVWENEDDSGENIASQQLTNFFDGIGKTSFITVVASSNHPHRLPARLVRKWRFDSTIVFPEMMSEDEVREAIKLYISKYWLDQICNIDHINIYTPRMIGFTWSMVADFYGKILAEIDFRKETWESSDINPADIESIFVNLHISRDEFEKQKKETADWLEWVRNNPGKQKIGF
jgi:hypothetical protein